MPPPCLMRGHGAGGARVSAASRACLIYRHPLLAVTTAKAQTLAAQRLNERSIDCEASAVQPAQVVAAVQRLLPAMKLTRARWHALKVTRHHPKALHMGARHVQ
jgi:hypothetical protein